MPQNNQIPADFSPNFFDQLQNMVGVDNERTRALQALRANGAAQIAQPQQVPVQPVGGVPGGGTATPGSFDAFIQNLQNQFKGLNEQYNTGHRIERALAQAEAGGPGGTAQVVQPRPPGPTAQALQQIAKQQ